MQFANVAAAAVSFALAISGGMMATREIAPYIALNGTDTKQIAVLRGGAVSAGLSLGSKTLLLRECTNLAQSTVAMVLGAERRGDLSRVCNQLAQAMTHEMPTYSEAWLLRARTSIAALDAQAFNVELATTRATSPNVHWLAAARVKLSEDHYDILDEENRLGNLQDLMALTSSTVGLRALAENYVARPAARDRIAAVVEETSEEIQGQFLYLVQSASPDARQAN